MPGKDREFVPPTLWPGFSPFRILEDLIIIGAVTILKCLNCLDQVTLCPRLVKLCQIDTPKVVLNLAVEGVILTACV